MHEEASLPLASNHITPLPAFLILRGVTLIVHAGIFIRGLLDPSRNSQYATSVLWRPKRSALQASKLKLLVTPITLQS